MDLKQFLKDLRSDIVLNSLYLADYRNRYEISADDVFIFFSGYLDFIENEARNKKQKINDNNYWEKIAEQDTTNNLIIYFKECGGWIGNTNTLTLLRG